MRLATFKASQAKVVEFSRAHKDEEALAATTGQMPFLMHPLFLKAVLPAPQANPELAR